VGCVRALYEGANGSREAGAGHDAGGFVSRMISGTQI